MKNRLSFKINNDIFKHLDTRQFLRGKNLHDYDKKIIAAVIKHYVTVLSTTETNLFTPSTQKGLEIFKFLKDIYANSPNITFDELMVLFEAEMVEELVGYCLLAFQNKVIDLFLRLTYTFARIVPLETPESWFDNYRLNGYGNIFNRIMYGRYDHPSIYTLDYLYEPVPINQNITIDYERMIKFVIGSLTAFIIDYDIFPDGQYRSRGLSPQEICDEFYRRFPFAFMGAHGCDVFYIGMTLTLEEIDKMLMRYPSLRVGFILNTAGYRSNSSGQHWVCLMLGNKQAQLICSQAGTFKDFDDRNRLHDTLRNLMFGLSYNHAVIQVNNQYSCGEFSVLAIYALLCHQTIQKAVDAIGVNATNLLAGFDIDKIRARIVGSER